MGPACESVRAVELVKLVVSGESFIVL